MITSTMQDDFPLTITAILEHGSKVFPDSEAVTWQGGDARRETFADVARNAARLAHALAKLGIGAGDPVGTFCWNNNEHLEAYYAVPCMGAVLHTLNIRLTPAQLTQIVNHAGDKTIIVDGTLVGLLAPLVDQFPTVEHYVVIGAADPALLEALGAGAGDVLHYDRLLADESPDYDWPVLDERSAASMCYTSGTTGDPKGVVYSHRSVFLHAMGNMTPAGLAANDGDRILDFVPMFHVNAWGLPFGAFLSGASLLFPGPHMTPEPVCALIHAERATMASAVPTIWAGILDYGRDHDIALGTLRMGMTGGAAIPRSVVEAFQDKYGVRLIQGWGMTETSPVGGMAHPPAGVEWGTTQEMDYRVMSGRLLAGVQMRIVSDAGEELPWDGEAVGEIEVRGPWITASYYNADVPEKFDDGWLRTGDIGTIDRLGYFQITDRSKDVIKSGGEWISSVELENLLAANPDVQEAAVIGIPDDKWTERPLACVVVRDGAQPAPGELATFLDGKVASWQVPENWAFVDVVPKTTVGKFDKKVLRSMYADGELKVERTKD